MNDKEVYKLAGGDVLLWLNEGGAISIKTMDKFDDPVELADHEALELAELLVKLTRESGT